MLSCVFLIIFLLIFFVLIKKDHVYLIPMIMIVYSNINGLVSPENFALMGIIKFSDYGLVITLLLLVFGIFKLRKLDPEYVGAIKKDPLFNAINVFWVYYMCLFVYSVLIQRELIWPIKMGRYFFYGLNYYLIYLILIPNPIINFNKIVNCLMVATLIFGLLYIVYNLFDWNVYPTGEYESFRIKYINGNIKRNFSGFPTFAYFFILLFTDRLFQRQNNIIFYLIGLAILLICILLMLTRGLVIMTGLMVGFMAVYRRFSAHSLRRITVLVSLIAITLVLLPLLAEGHYQTMLMRFGELFTQGLTGSANFRVRSDEFMRIVKDVINFNPLFGFGFTLAKASNYNSYNYTVGSSDNGYSNLIGVTGFVGLGIFIAMIICWFIVNIRLQAMKVESYSRVNFVLIIFMLGIALDSSYISYTHNFVLFMVYDILAYAHFRYNCRRIIHSHG